MIRQQCLIVETDQNAVNWFVLLNLVFDFNHHFIWIQFLLALLNIFLALFHFMLDGTQLQLLDLQFVIVPDEKLPVVFGFPHLLNQAKSVGICLELLEGGLLN